MYNRTYIDEIRRDKPNPKVFAQATADDLIDESPLGLSLLRLALPTHRLGLLPTKFSSADRKKLQTTITKLLSDLDNNPMIPTTEKHQIKEEIATWTKQISSAP